MALLSLSSCFAPLCDTSTPIPMLDGGTAVCLKAEDCPRPGNVFVCVDTADESTTCVTCESTRCATITKGACP